MRQVTKRLAAAGTVAVVLTGMAGCDQAGVERNFDRGTNFADVMAGANLRETSDMTGLTGTASYAGSAVGQFQGDESFTATADLAMTADFSNGTLSGAMTGWTPEDPGNYTMRGQVLISNGAITPDGLFDAQIAGNVERRPTAQRLADAREAAAGEDDPLPLPRRVQVVFTGSAEGAFHDTAVTGERATHVEGRFNAPNASGFFAGRRD